MWKLGFLAFALSLPLPLSSVGYLGNRNGGRHLSSLQRRNEAEFCHIRSLYQGSEQLL